MPKIRVEIREVYGNRQTYPVCETAKTFAKLAGTITLTPAALGYIKQLGYEIEVVTPMRAELERQGFKVVDL